MSFVEPAFALFLLVVLAVFLALPSLRLQLSWLLAASYLFYAWWDPRFLVLLLTSSAVDFVVGLAIPRARSTGVKKGLLVLSLAVNLGLLGTFKYAGFLTESLARAVERLGLTWDVPTIDLILPIGISFYTFQTLSYTIDVYRGKIESCRSPLQFFFFVAAFPQLVAGPIVRARELLPQFHGDLRERIRTGGLFLVLYGVFKKVCVADPLGTLVVGPVFGASAEYNSWSHLLAVYGFAFQIFLDFSAYTDIARGCGRLFGLELPINFRSPYLARSPTEYWNRWHITLSTWFRDYLYFPLGGNRKGALRTYVNVMIVVLLGGLWHGAAWHFIVWGGLHGLLFVIYSFLPQPAEPQGRLRRVVAVLVFFNLGSFARVFFRADSFAAGVSFIRDGFSAGAVGTTLGENVYLLLFCGLLIHNYAEPRLERWAEAFDDQRSWLLALMAVIVLTACVWISYRYQAQQAFIYFQF
jgi:D-alanyl-lipoteichoic acid acyltransferase DltB (MBOAT superfamily)